MTEELKEKVKHELDEIVAQTTKLSFPFLASEKKKQIMLEEEKSKIEIMMLGIISKYDITIPKDTIQSSIDWEAIAKESKKEFESLPQKQKLNSFYLQELMHNYAECFAELIKQYL